MKKTCKPNIDPEQIPFINSEANTNTSIDSRETVQNHGYKSLEYFLNPSA